MPFRIRVSQVRILPWALAAGARVIDRTDDVELTSPRYRWWDPSRQVTLAIGCSLTMGRYAGALGGPNDRAPSGRVVRGDGVTEAAGKTSNEAMRALKRRLSDIVFRHMVDDADRTYGDGPGRTPGTSTNFSVTVRIPMPALRRSHFPDRHRPA